MEQRTRHQLRRLVDLTVQAVERGLMPLATAAETLDAAGAPFEVVCRVLLPFKPGMRGLAEGASDSAWSEFAPR